MMLSKTGIPAWRMPATHGEDAASLPLVRVEALEGQTTEIPMTLPTKRTTRRQVKCFATLGTFFIGSLISAAVPTTISGVRVNGNRLLMTVAIAATSLPESPSRIKVFVAPGSFQ